MRVKRPRFVETAERRDAAEAELLALRREMRQLELLAARRLAEIDTSAHFVYRGCSSIAHFGERHGFSGREARRLAAVGKALALQPALEERILCGKLSLDAAAALGQVLANPDLVRDGDDWLRWAEEWSARELERKIRERAVEVESGGPASVMTAVMTASGRIKFEHARQLACRKQSRALTEGETVEVLADHYLDSFDAARRKPRARRMPSTVGRTGRHVPAAVAREVRARKGGKCAVPGCDHDIWVEKAHLWPHRLGGSREAHNLVELCRHHHRLYDEGLLEISGTAEKPIFSTPDDDVIREGPVRRESCRGPPAFVGT